MKQMNIHFIGIGGIGISALAQYCHHRGDHVTGSEISETNIIPHLRELGIRITLPQKAENIPSKCDLTIYTEAVPPDNPERKGAEKRSIPQKSYFEYLGELSKEHRTIAVCGTHGKTTTVGLIASGFQAVDFDATVFVGSTLREFGESNFHLGTNNWLLVEACEYRNSFQFLWPDIIVLTNVELDHPDYYKSEEQYFQAFREFCSKAKIVICHNDDPNVERLFGKLGNEELQLLTLESDENLSLQIYGKHNRENAALATKLAKQLELDIDEFKEGLHNYKGAGRRQEYLGEKEGIKIFDDYGHHPTEISVTLQSFREQFPGKKIGLIFEPHQFSRTRQFLNEFKESLEQADLVGIFPIYAARDTEEDLRAVSVNDLINRIDGAFLVRDQDDVTNITKKLDSGDVLIFMGAGKVDQFAREFVR